MAKGSSMRRTRGNAKRLLLFAAAKGCFTTANSRVSKSFMVVGRGKGLLRSGELEKMKKFGSLFIAAM